LHILLIAITFKIKKLEFPMPNTYTQLHIQLVFAVQHRDGLVHPYFKEELQKYITGIFTNQKNKLLAINLMPDHAHIFFGLNPSLAISDIVRDVKHYSTEFINGNNWLRGHFNWQEGYSAFSYSHSHVERVIKYILNQEIHHKKRTFHEEYLEMLKKFEVIYQDKYLFEFFD